MNDVTRILSAIEQGDPKAAGDLLPLVYDELRRLAARRLAREAPGQTLQATALVHEAYLRLVGDGEGRPGTAGGTSSPPRPRPCGGSSSRTPAADGARNAAAAATAVELDPAGRGRPRARRRLLALDEALDRLAALDPPRPSWSSSATSPG